MPIRSNSDDEEPLRAIHAAEGSFRDAEYRDFDLPPVNRRRNRKASSLNALRLEGAFDPDYEA